MSRSRAKGTGWETAIVNYLQATAWPYAERRALQGYLDKGDIAGIPGVVIEAKNAQRLQVPLWFEETMIEQENAGAAIGALWMKRKGKASPADGYVVIDGETFVHLLREAGYA